MRDGPTFTTLDGAVVSRVGGGRERGVRGDNGVIAPRLPAADRGTRSSTPVLASLSRVDPAAVELKCNALTAAFMRSSAASHFTTACSSASSCTAVMGAGFGVRAVLVLEWLLSTDLRTAPPPPPRCTARPRTNRVFAGWSGAATRCAAAYGELPVGALGMPKDLLFTSVGDVLSFGAT